MTDWPRILVDVDDDRPAGEDEVEHCEHCGEPVLEGVLQRHLGEGRCDECRPLCPVCCDAEVSEPEQFFPACAMWACWVDV